MTARVGASILLGRARAEPFGDLAPPTSSQDRGSRAQAGPAILLYRALQGRADDPLAVTAAVIEAAALRFLAQAIGPLAITTAASAPTAPGRDGAPSTLDRRINASAASDPPAEDPGETKLPRREAPTVDPSATPNPAAAMAALVADRIARFPNVDAEVDHASADGVSFTVTRCRLVELVHAAGHPELAPLFCAADQHYFGEVEPDVTLDRPTTIADGHAVCRFILTRAHPPPASSESP